MLVRERKAPPPPHTQTVGCVCVCVCRCLLYPSLPARNVYDRIRASAACPDARTRTPHENARPPARPLSPARTRALSACVRTAHVRTRSFTRARAPVFQLL